MAKQTFTTGQVLTAAQMTSLQQTAMGGGSTTAKTTSYVLVAADAGTVVQMNAAGATTITVNTALFAAGDTVQIQNIGAGVCTVTAGTATVSTSSVLALSQYDGGSLYFTATGAAIYFAWDAADSTGMTNPMTTTGDIIYSSSGSTPARLGIGTTGQNLTVAAGLPSWTTSSSGGMTLISTTTLSGSSTVLSSIPATYTNLMVQIDAMTNNTTSGSFTVRVGADIDCQGIAINDATPASFGGGANIVVSTPLRTNSENGFLLMVYNYSAAIQNHSFEMIGTYTSSAPALKRYAAWGTNGSSGSLVAISSLTFLNTGGTWSAGTVKLWGIK